MEITCTETELMILKKIAMAAAELDVETYLVGGFVRDKILDRSTKDADIVCVGDGIELATAVARHFKPVPQVSYFKNFGTAHIKVNVINKNDLPQVSPMGGDLEGAAFDIEFVGARKESYRFESRKPAVEPGSIEDDQKRRDFTMNALAISLNRKDYGKLIDPFDGLKDIESKIIRTPLEPTQTFSDDPLRMMRAIRFATQLDFVVEEKTLQAIKESAERINIISQERITDELNKIVLSPRPSIGFDLLYKTGLLEIIFPSMVELAGAEYKDGHGHKDNFYHTLQVLDNIAVNTDDLWLRWAAILHDIAKPVTKRFEEGHGWTFHGHEVVGGRMVPKNVVMMPSYVNIGAYVDEGTMVDTWATVGSCAQIGKGVHLSGGVGIGGVLEPLQASPVIIEDGCFIGSRCIVVEGVIVEKEAVLGANVVLTQSTKIIDVSGNEPVETKGRVPARSVVIPGSYTKKFPAGEYGVGCALIIGQRKPSTDLKTSLNDCLRDFNVSV